MKKQIFIREADENNAAPAQQPAPANTQSQPADTAQQGGEQSQGGEDLLPKIKEVLAGAKKRLDDEVLAEVKDEEQKKTIIDSFKNKLTEKIKTTYKDNEELMNQALGEVETLLKQPEEAEITPVSAADQDPWLATKDEWLREQRKKLNDWF